MKKNLLTLGVIYGYSEWISTSFYYNEEFETVFTITADNGWKEYYIWAKISPKDEQVEIQSIRKCTTDKNTHENTYKDVTDEKELVELGIYSILPCYGNLVIETEKYEGSNNCTHEVYYINFAFEGRIEYDQTSYEHLPKHASMSRR